MKTFEQAIDIIGTFKNRRDTWEYLYEMISSRQIDKETYFKVLNHYKIFENVIS